MLRFTSVDLAYKCIEHEVNRHSLNLPPVHPCRSEDALDKILRPQNTPSLASAQCLAISGLFLSA